MDHGRIVEQGTHDELLAARGPYYNLYNAQFTQAMVDMDAEAPAPAPARPVGAMMAGRR